MEKPKEEAALKMVLQPIGIILSPITKTGKGPRMGSESAVSGKLIVDEKYRDALFGLQKGEKIVILYWMHLAQRDILQVHPRGDRTRPLRGVFSTRSPQRPNPISLDTVEITGINGNVIDVTGLDALDGTPLLDIKCIV
jgi:tRNA (adenine37-N6)-methyltransferase